MKESIAIYEKTSWWKNLSYSLLSPPDTACEICGKPHWAIAKRDSRVHKNRVKGTKYLIRRFAVHHKHYRHPYKEQRSDLMILCNQDHEVGHRLANLARQNKDIYGFVYQAWCQATGWESEENIS
jgi:hypothetical protein